jgi:SAM-dependent methyltransferase
VFPDGMVGVIRLPNGGYALPSGEVRADDGDARDAALRILLETAGFRRQTFHEFARRGTHVHAWCEGDEYHGRRPHADVRLEVGEPDAIAELLRSSGAPDLAEIVDAAASSHRTIDRDVFAAEQHAWIERAYLTSDTAEGGSGFGGTPEEWRAAREPITDGIEREGTFLDLGCANGLLMGSVARWCAERGLSIEPYGLDIAPGLVERARERLPQWADRIWVGDAAAWVHPGGRRFDYVHVLLDCVPDARRGELAAHALRELVVPGGRLLASAYVRGTAHDRTAAQVLADLGYDVVGECRAPRGDPHTPPSTAWIDAPPGGTW